MSESPPDQIPQVANASKADANDTVWGEQSSCTESVQTMLKADEEYEEKSADFNYAWILEKLKMIVSGLDTKVNLRVSLHDAITNYIMLKQQTYETNDAYLTRFKSMVGTLKIAGGEHILVSSVMLKIFFQRQQNKR